MKHIKAFALLTLLIAALATVVVAKSKTGTMQFQNNTTENLGIVTINPTSGSPVHLPVTGSGLFDSGVTGTVASVVINGVSVSVGDPPTQITLPNTHIITCSIIASSPPIATQ